MFNKLGDCKNCAEKGNLGCSCSEPSDELCFACGTNCSWDEPCDEPPEAPPDFDIEGNPVIEDQVDEDDVFPRPAPVTEAKTLEDLLESKGLIELALQETKDSIKTEQTLIRELQDDLDKVTLAIHKHVVKSSLRNGMILYKKDDKDLELIEIVDCELREVPIKGKEKVIQVRRLNIHSSFFFLENTTYTETYLLRNFIPLTETKHKPLKDIFYNMVSQHEYLYETAQLELKALQEYKNV